MDGSSRATWLIAALIVTAGLSGCIGGGEDQRRSGFIELHQALIWDHPYPHLVIDIDHVEGRAPSQLALDALEETLLNVTDKETVTIQTSELVEVGDTSRDRAWDGGEVWAVHERSFEPELDRLWGSGDTAYLHLLFLNGHLARGEGHVSQGVQMLNALVVFPDRSETIVASVDSYGPPNPSPEVAERRTVIHELGHAMGLVNNGAPMLHERIYDDPCRCHSAMEDSVMYGGGASPTGSPLEYHQDNQWVPYKFDEYDLADLEAVRQAGRAIAGSR